MITALLLLWLLFRFWFGTGITVIALERVVHLVVMIHTHKRFDWMVFEHAPDKQIGLDIVRALREVMTWPMAIKRLIKLSNDLNDYK